MPPLSSLPPWVITHSTGNCLKPKKITANRIRYDTVKNESERKKMERHFEIFGKFVSEIKRDTVVEIKVVVIYRST